MLKLRLSPLKRLLGSNGPALKCQERPSRDSPHQAAPPRSGLRGVQRTEPYTVSTFNE